MRITEHGETVCWNESSTWLHSLVAAEKSVNNDHDAELYEDLLSLSMTEYNKISKGNYRWIPVEILDMSRIYDTGIHFSIKIAIALSNCTKIACIFEIFRPNWRKSAKAKLLTCSNYNSSEEVTETSSPRSDASAIVEMTSRESIKTSRNWLEPKTLMLWNNFLNFINSVSLHRIGSGELSNCPRFKRPYSSLMEQLNRFKIYMQNMHFAQKLQYEEKGTAAYGETQFSDMTPEEFKRFRLAQEGVVTPVKIKVCEIVAGSCGSCWAFSVTGNIESLWAIKTGDLISLSEQELIDCDVVDKGCNGGLPINAFREIQRMGGLEPEDQYPYKAKNGTCHLVRKDIAVSIDDAVEIPNNETIMKAWIAQRGPLSVGIDAELLAYYKSGILHPSHKRCPPSKINHGVLITGYGIENGLPYWAIKNSWGQRWGENGYFRLRRGRDVCGVSDLVSSAIIY
ncbi:Secreted cathepsin F [Dirofilaria immitis]|nr:Secreted cathepsin F [Dirofilaria immitis]